MTHIADFNQDEQYRARVVKTDRLTPPEKEEVRELTLEISEPEFRCSVNQSFGVLVPTNGEFGKDTHHRLYSIADIPTQKNGTTRIKMLVKRCQYVDEYSGEKYPGVASNYLCDRKTGDNIAVTGPYGIPFHVPDDHSSNLILIGMGTGIAPFRAFIKHIYKNIKDWNGKIRLFYGAKSGMELLYLNDKDGDLTNYYDEATFKAFKALSPRPHWADPVALEQAMEKEAVELREMLSMNNTYVYIAGYEKIKPKLDKAFSGILGSEQNWARRKAELQAGHKWAEIIY